MSSQGTPTFVPWPWLAALPLILLLMGGGCGREDGPTGPPEVSLPDGSTQSPDQRDAPVDTGGPYPEREAPSEGPGIDAPLEDDHLPDSGRAPDRSHPPEPGFEEPSKPEPVPDRPTQPDNGCPGVNIPAAPSPWSHRAKGAGFGGISTQYTGGHRDVFLTSPAGLTRIGARLDWGGAIVFFGLSSDPRSNVIDANDTGRELQLALYDPTRAAQGCAHNASCKSKHPCPTSITFLGWNPVQGGDECGNGGRVLSYKRVGDALRLEIQPIQWNPDWNQVDCRKSSCPRTGLPVQVVYTIELRFLTEHTVEVASQVKSNESFSHPPTGQEFPTLYVSHGKGGPDLPLLLDSAGMAFNPNTPGNDGFYYGNFKSPAPWVTWQTSNRGYGVGLLMDQGMREFQGWRGDGRKAPYFHNVRAKIVFGLDAGATVRGISYLLLGSYKTIGGEAAQVVARRPPFGSLDPPSQRTIRYVPGKPVSLHGWALDSGPIKTIQARIDGRSVATLKRNQKRTDVCAVYPAYPGCPVVGFAGSVPTNGLSACPHHLQVVAVDVDGNTSVLGERELVR